MKSCAFTTQGSGWSELDVSGTQCCAHGHFGAFLLRTGPDVGVGASDKQGRSRAGCSWAGGLVGHECTMADKLCEYCTSQVCREGPHFCLGYSFLNPE